MLFQKQTHKHKHTSFFFLPEKYWQSGNERVLAFRFLVFSYLFSVCFPRSFFSPLSQGGPDFIADFRLGIEPLDGRRIWTFAISFVLLDMRIWVLLLRSKLVQMPLVFFWYVDLNFASLVWTFAMSLVFLDMLIWCLFLLYDIERFFLCFKYKIWTFVCAFVILLWIVTI